MIKKICPILCAILSAVTMFVGCGKKADEESPKSQPPIYNPQTSEIEEQLQKQELFCGSNRTCPSYLAKIAVIHKDKVRFCTGFLMKDDVIVTSSSCLPERLRLKDLSCKSEIFFFFSETGTKPTRVGCDKILEVSQLQGTDAYLWRNDVAYLKVQDKDLPETSSRRNAVPERAGLTDMDSYYTWSIDQIDDHQGIIRKTDDCRAVLNSYFNPLATSQSSPTVLLAGCDYHDGNAGSPLLDYRGRVRGIISKPVAQEDIDEVISMNILERGLKSLVHVTNYACAPIIPYQEVLNETECNKKLDISVFDLGQREMINEAVLFKNSIQRLEHMANEKNRYLNLAIRLEPKEDGYNVNFYPKCFKNVSKWIGEFNNNKPFTFNIELPVMSIRKSMNEYGKIYAQEEVSKNKPTNFQFRPRILQNTKAATVFKWSDGPTETFPNLTENCELLF